MAKQQTKERAIQAVEEIYASLHRTTISAKRQHSILEFGILILSTITTGMLWSLISGILPIISVWVGALASSTVTILAGYQRIFAPKSNFENAAKLYQDAGQLLADLKSTSQFDEKHFWRKYKLLQSELILFEWKASGKRGYPQLPA